MGTESVVLVDLFLSGQFLSTAQSSSLSVFGLTFLKRFLFRIIELQKCRRAMNLIKDSEQKNSQGCCVCAIVW